MIRVTRRYDFSAAHVLARPDWPRQRNQQIYGKCANPAGHGHNYRIEVVIEGELDGVTGRVLPEERLDEVVRTRVLAKLDGRFLNLDVSSFRDAVPTAENIARFVWDTLAGHVAPARLVGVRLVETRNNSVEYDGAEEFA